MSKQEIVAREIYWAAYDQYIDATYTHPLGFTKEAAWRKISPAQRVFCLNQARRAIAALEPPQSP